LEGGIQRAEFPVVGRRDRHLGFGANQRWPQEAEPLVEVAQLADHHAGVVLTTPFFQDRLGGEELIDAEVVDES
jgi:hypothetical protein